MSPYIDITPLELDELDDELEELELELELEELDEELELAPDEEDELELALEDDEELELEEELELLFETSSPIQALSTNAVLPTSMALVTAPTPGIFKSCLAIA